MEGNLEEAVGIINELIERIENAHLNIALTGESGSGKSSFINAFLGIGHEDGDAASTRVMETTTSISSYEHPKFPNVTFWDLPDIGTPNFQPKSYLKQVNFSDYDFFFIFSSARFRENDAKLAQEIRQMGKKFYFVRTKVDSDLDNERKAKPKSFNRENVLQQIRKNCSQHLQKVGIEEPQVFLISNFELASFDFPKLLDILGEELPEHKRHVFLLSLPNISEAIINQKKATLQEKIWLKDLTSVLQPFSSLMGMSREDNIAQLQKHLNDYQRAFGVDDASLLKISQESNRSIEELKTFIKSPHLLTIKEDESLSERYAEIFCSLNGGLLATGPYYRKSYKMQLYFLETVADDAKTLLREIWESSV
ncbi:T-cell-specific guanine nucleotide triphosphate-binding protein 2-like [Gracilinanus agilis]|uniref:T-cell-specific guanine nucleotide triphosphate-binding protein 2-like n=1 Tax=Gracilinanus agilis TaxID=191870 RepID=UPI001CFD0781|nr:T-cell-specific guanine nucleotide triphosphate-binding protein 2-like [Gracilinanus agilis]